MSFQLLISGISLGAVNALMRLGFALVFQRAQVQQFLAHGGMISACAYIGYYFQRSFETPPPILVTDPVHCVLRYAAFVFHRSGRLPPPAQKTGADIYYFLASITLSIMIVQILAVFYGKNLYAYPPIFESTTFFVGSIRFSSIDTLILIVSLAILRRFDLHHRQNARRLAIRAVAINSADEPAHGDRFELHHRRRLRYRRRARGRFGRPARAEVFRLTDARLADDAQGVHRVRRRRARLAQRRDHRRDLPRHHRDFF
jgi:branched-subunit amino acid ABC-type transport system permease component